MSPQFELDNENKTTATSESAAKPSPAAAAKSPEIARKTATAARKGVIRMAFDDNRALYQAYMPFVSGCGLFYPTSDEFPLYPSGGKESEVFVMVKLPDEDRQYSFAGRVVWQNPKKPVMKRVPGIGIQLVGKGVEQFKELIESKIGKMLATGLPTMTL